MHKCHSFCVGFVMSQAVPIPVLYLYLLVFLHCVSLFGRCWGMYKELWQRAATALTHACLPSYSLSAAEPQTHAHVWKTHTAQLLYESPTLFVDCMSNKQNTFSTFSCCLSSSIPFSFCHSSCSCHACFQDKPPSRNKRGLSVSRPHACFISFFFSSN